MKLLFVTTSRADWNGLGMVAKAALAAGHEVKVAATGQHVWPPHPTRSIIEEDGFKPESFAQASPYILQSGVYEIPAVHGLIVEHAGKIMDWPDIVVIAGDRWETHAVATAAALCSIPIAHIAGGDITRGSLDDKLRDSISMLSQLHFCTNEQAADRLWSMLGHPENRIFPVGSPALDRVRATRNVSRETLFKWLGVMPRSKNILVSVHPDTLGPDPAATAYAILHAVTAEDLFRDSFFLLLEPNADAGRDKVQQALLVFEGSMGAQAQLRANLPAEIYYGVLSHFDLMVGNSSAALYESPLFGIPAIDVGDRQEGRHRAINVHGCPPEPTLIRALIRQLLAGRIDLAAIRSPYGAGNSAPVIVEVLGHIKEPRALLRRPR